MLTFIEEIEKSGIARAFFTQNDPSPWKNASDYGEICRTLSINAEQIVRASQTHTATVRVVSAKNGGEGVTKPLEMTDYDGIITNSRGILLATVEADCVPVYLLDTKKGVVGMVHSGWRGTAEKISAAAVRKMESDFSSKPEDIIAHIGPHICAECYEVGGELIDKFSTTFGHDLCKRFFTPKENGKYLLDMKSAVCTALESEGVKSENISFTPLCTYTTTSLCSFRRTASKTERMLTGIILK